VFGSYIYLVAQHVWLPPLFGRLAGIWRDNVSLTTSTAKAELASSRCRVAVATIATRLKLLVAGSLVQDSAEMRVVIAAIGRYLDRIYAE
jgi:hypothetical protein